MNKEELCYDIFNEIKELSEKWNRVGFRINLLSSSVQNPKWIKSENFEATQDYFVMLKQDIDNTYNYVNDELKKKYNEIYDIYYNGKW